MYFCHYFSNFFYITQFARALLRDGGTYKYIPRANGTKRRSGRKPGARVTNSALAEFKVVGS